MLFRSLLSLLLLQYAAAVPGNDICIAATKLTEGEEVMGDNSDANFDYNSQGVCGSRSDRRAVWYEIVGTGQEVTVSVCTNNGAVTDFGVFFQCNDQMCLGHPDQQDEPSNCEDDAAVTYTFLAEENENYFVHVRADWLDGVGSQFTIKYTEPESSGDGDSEDGDSAASTVSMVSAIGAAGLTAGLFM